MPGFSQHKRKTRLFWRKTRFFFETWLFLFTSKQLAIPESLGSSGKNDLKYQVFLKGLEFDQLQNKKLLFNFENFFYFG